MLQPRCQPGPEADSSATRRARRSVGPHRQPVSCACLFTKAGALAPPRPCAGGLIRRDRTTNGSVQRSSTVRGQLSGRDTCPGRSSRRRQKRPDFPSRTEYLQPTGECPGQLRPRVKRPVSGPWPGSIHGTCGSAREAQTRRRGSMLDERLPAPRRRSRSPDAISRQAASRQSDAPMAPVRTTQPTIRRHRATDFFTAGPTTPSDNLEPFCPLSAARE
jgi:hypothetical protein